MEVAAFDADCALEHTVTENDNCIEELLSIVPMKRADIFRLLRLQRDANVSDKELRMTFISLQRGSLVPVVESRPPAPRLDGVPPARERRGEMFFFF